MSNPGRARLPRPEQGRGEPCHQKYALAAILALSLAVRLLGVAYMNRHLAWNLVPPDTRGVYRPLALSFADGHGYQLGGDLREATRVAPLFPVYLAGVYRVESPTVSDLARCRELQARYADLTLGVVDASVVALAERLSEPKVATLDQRHFRAVRPAHVDTLDLRP